jgi:hypothetical protein
MADKREKKAKLGRNDPCWCGSGKKYKDCHLPIEEARRADQRKLRQAYDTLLPRIMESAEHMTGSFLAALELFWNGKYTVEQMSELDDLEDRGSERFLTWLAFDHKLEDGRTLIETLAQAADDGTFEADEHETRLLHDWTEVRLRPYVIEEVRKGKGLLVQDLLNQTMCDIEEHAASRRLLQGEVLVGHLVPVGRRAISGEAVRSEETPDATEEPIIYHVAGAMAQLTEDTSEKLIEFAQLHLEDMRRTQPDATLDDLPGERSHVLNHFVMELPEEYSPGVLDDILLHTRMALQLAGISLPSSSSDENTSDEQAEVPEADSRA